MIGERIENVKDALGASPGGCAVVPGLFAASKGRDSAQGVPGAAAALIPPSEQVGSGRKPFEQQIGVFDGKLVPPIKVLGTIVDARQARHLVPESEANHVCFRRMPLIHDRAGRRAPAMRRVDAMISGIVESVKQSVLAHAAV